MCYQLGLNGIWTGSERNGKSATEGFQRTLDKNKERMARCMWTTNIHIERSSVWKYTQWLCNRAWYDTTYFHRTEIKLVMIEENALLSADRTGNNHVAFIENIFHKNVAEELKKQYDHINFASTIENAIRNWNWNVITTIITSISYNLYIKYV